MNTDDFLNQLATLPKRVELLEEQREYWAKPVNDMLEHQRALIDRVMLKQNEHDMRFTNIDRRLYKLEEGQEELKARAGKLEERMDKFEDRMDKLEDRMDRIENRMDKLEGRIENLEGGQKEIIARISNLEVMIQTLIERS